MTSRCTEEKEWEYLPVTDVMEAERIWTIKEYIQRRQATIAAEVDLMPIYEMCTGAEHIPGSIRMMRWWDQDMGREEE